MYVMRRGILKAVVCVKISPYIGLKKKKKTAGERRHFKFGSDRFDS